MEGITLEDVYLMVKHDIGAGNKNPETHIEKYVKRMCKKQRDKCNDEYMKIKIKDAFEDRDIQFSNEIKAILNAPEPGL